MYEKVLPLLKSYRKCCNINTFTYKSNASHIDVLNMMNMNGIKPITIFLRTSDRQHLPDRAQYTYAH